MAKPAKIKRQDIEDVCTRLGIDAPKSPTKPAVEWWKSLVAVLAARLEGMVLAPGKDAASIQTHASQLLGLGSDAASMEAWATVSPVTRIAWLVRARLTLQDHFDIPGRLLSERALWEAVAAGCQISDAPSCLALEDLLRRIVETDKQGGPELAGVGGTATVGALELTLDKLAIGIEWAEDEAPDNSEDGGETTELDDEVADLTDFGSSINTTDVVTLLNSVKDGTLDLNPPWQRQYVWTPRKQALLIESILLKIPLPSIIILEDEGETGLVIDGKQRLTTLHRFVNGDFRWPGSKIDRIVGKQGQVLLRLNECKNKKFNDFPAWAKTRVLKAPISRVAVKQVSKQFLYSIFERYNTTGTTLNAPEIRHAVYMENMVYRVLFHVSERDLQPSELPDGGSVLESREADRQLRERVWELFGEKGKTVATGPGSAAAGPDWRFNGVSLLCRYLAHAHAPVRVSLAARAPTDGETSAHSKDGFSRQTTAQVVRTFLDQWMRRPIPDQLAFARTSVRDLRDILDLAQNLYGGDFHTTTQSGGSRAKIHLLRAVTNMVACRLLVLAIREEVCTSDDAEFAIRETEASCTLTSDQTTRTIWEHQAKYVLSVLESLPPDARAFLEDKEGTFLARMRWLKSGVDASDVA
ncbi:MAG: DUF262 domain-containing protein [Fimbriimonadaceae bacterium]